MNTLNLEDRMVQGIDTKVLNPVDNSTMDSIFIKIQDRFRKILFNDILYIEASGSYCNFYLLTGDKIIVTYSLADTIQHLSEVLFIRVHRSFVINKKHVTGYVGNIFYMGEHIIPIGRQYKKEALSRFNILGIIS